MKNSLYSAYLFFFFIFLLLLISCEKELINDTTESILSEEVINTSIRYLSADDLPKVVAHIQNEMSLQENLRTSQSNNIANGRPFVDMGNIMEVTNRDKITNYTFGMHLDGAPDNEIYNIVVNRQASGNLKKPYIIKYTVDEKAMDQFVASGYDARKFYGSYAIYPFHTFFRNGQNNSNGASSSRIASTNSGDCHDGNVSGGGSSADMADPGDVISVGDGAGGTNVSSTFGSTIGNGNFTYTYTSNADTRTGTYSASTLTSSGLVSVSVGGPSASTSINVFVDTNTESLRTNANVGSGSNCTVIIMKYDLEGNASAEFRSVPCPDVTNDSQQRIASTTSDCPEPEGEVGLLPRPNNECQDGYIYDIETNRCYSDEFFDEQIFLDQSFKNNPCLKSVYDDMGKASTFNNYLQSFEPEFSIANLRFSSDDEFSSNHEPKYHDAMAITNPPINSNEIKINFNTDPSLNSQGNVLTKPDVYKAVAMIHEIIHAEMYRKMLDALQDAQNNQTTLDWANDWTPQQFQQFTESLQNKYFGIFDYYTRYDWNSSTPSNAQHQAMATHYRNIIKNALTDYEPTLTETQKDALSWLGLNGANIVAWQNLESTQQTSINNTLSQIKTNFSNGCN